MRTRAHTATFIYGGGGAERRQLLGARARLVGIIAEPGARAFAQLRPEFAQQLLTGARMYARACTHPDLCDAHSFSTNEKQFVMAVVRECMCRARVRFVISRCDICTPTPRAAVARRFSARLTCGEIKFAKRKPY